MCVSVQEIYRKKGVVENCQLPTAFCQLNSQLPTKLPAAPCRIIPIKLTPTPQHTAEVNNLLKKLWYYISVFGNVIVDLMVRRKAWRKSYKQ